MPIPRWLGINWWWLFGANAVVRLLWWHFYPHLIWLPQIAEVWLLVQAGWLWWIDSRSKAIFWLLAATLVPLALLAVSVSAPHWYINPNTLFVALAVMIALYVTGIIRFCMDLEHAFDDGESPHLWLSSLYAVLFSSFYIQSQLHKLYQSGRNVCISTTPATA